MTYDLADEPVTSTDDVAAALAAAMTQRGYRVYDDGERSLLYRLGESPERVSLAELRERTRTAALRILTHDAEHADAAKARLARATARLIEQNVPGSATYIARVATGARDRLPLLSEKEHEEIATSLRRPTAKRERGNYHAERRAKLAAQYDEHARKVLTHWLTGLPSGKHDLGELWTVWRAAVTSAPNITEKFPGALALGKKSFYALLGELGTVKNGHARRRYLLVS